MPTPTTPLPPTLTIPPRPRQRARIQPLRVDDNVTPGWKSTKSIDQLQPSVSLNHSPGKQHTNQSRDTEQGFTIIELIIVVLILGILMMIAVPSYFEQRRSAIDTTVELDVRNTAINIESWLAGHPFVDVPAFVVKGDGTRTAITINNLDFRQGGYTARPDLNHTITGPLLDVKPSQEDTTLKVVPDDEKGGYRIFGSNNRGSLAYDLPETDEQEGISYNSVMGGRDTW